MVTGQDYGSGKTQMYIDVSKLAAVFEKQPGITESLLGFYVLAAGPYAWGGGGRTPSQIHKSGKKSTFLLFCNKRSNILKKKSTFR